MKKPKTINGLMKHLRSNGVNIKNSKQKIQLTNQGYYHGYKGYRFFGDSNKLLPITDYEQINRTIIYDTKLKSLFYDKIMFIETALKNISLDTIINVIKSDNVNDLYDLGIESFKNCPSNYDKKKKEMAQSKLLSLQSTVHSLVSSAYKKGNPKVTHFCNSVNYTNIPLWSIFEIMTMGDFGSLMSILVLDLRDRISRNVGINLSVDTDRKLLSKYIYALKDLRNAVAHNDVIYDVRFRKFDPNNAMRQCLIIDMKLPYVNFKDIVDYVALVIYFLKLLHVSKTEMKNFVRSFEDITDEYIGSVQQTITNITINNNWKKRIDLIKKFI